MASRRRKKNRSPALGAFLFLAALAVLAVVFAIEYPDIKRTLDQMDFMNLVRKSKTAATSTTSTTLSPRLPETTTSVPAQPVTTSPAPSRQAMPSPQTAPSSAAPVPVARPAQPGSAVSPTTVSTGTQPAEAVRVRQASLYFVRIEDDGIISSREVKRSIPVSDSPLTDAINALITGPSEAEIRSGLVSLVPRGTKLLGITVRGTTALIDLSDAFMYNHYGIEGYAAQLKQLVYTATAFSSVQDVQILVEGKTKDYLGGEGVFTGKPLSRNSF